MSLSLTEIDHREICLQINARSPIGGLFEGDRSHLHPDSRLPWRISPEPFWITPQQLRYLEQLGQVLFSFYRAADLLYRQSVKGLQPGWVHRYLDQGKPEEVIELGRMNRFKSQLPLVIRPDLLMTEDGFKVVELDSVPGGIGFTAQVSQLYAELGYDIIGGAEGLIDGFYEAIASTTKVDKPVVALLVSDESESYREEMTWLAAQLADRGAPVHCLHPRDIHFDEHGLLIEAEGLPLRVDAVYRFFELFDLKNIPKAEPIAYFAKKNAVRITPPLKAYLEEKMWLALFHHPLLLPFWSKELDPESIQVLTGLIPRSWIFDATPLPPHAVIPGLEVDGRAINDWRTLGKLTKKQREFVLKPSGFSELAYESRGVSIGHDLPEETWSARLQEGLDQFPSHPYILQKFHKSARKMVRYYDFSEDEIRPLRGRVLLRPYYYVVDKKPRLSGIQAVVCPPDKKVLHGMVDAVLVPCAVRNEPDAF